MGRSTPRKLGRGVLIALEGIDGTGKTTQGALLVARLEEEGWPVVATREPTSGEWGKRIRRLAREGRGDVSPEEEVEWFLRDRKEHVDQIIGPALKRGKIVVTDRYYFSTMAYQGALGIDPTRIREMNEALFPRPDLVLLLRVDPSVGMDRIEKSREGEPEVAYEKVEFLSRVADLYETFEDTTLRPVDAAEPPAEVQARVWSIVDPFLKALVRRGDPQSPAA